MTTTLENSAPRQPEEGPKDYTRTMEPELKPEKDKKRLSTAAKIGLFASGLAVTAGGILGLKAINGGSSPEGGPEVPSTSAPSNPGETTTTTPEKATEETVEIHLGGETIVGFDNFIDKYATIRENIPNAPVLSREEGEKVWADYVGTLQTAVNLEVEDEDLEQALVNKLLFVNGATGEFPDLIEHLRTTDAKITSVERIGLIVDPEAEGYVTGTVDITVSYPDGTVEQDRLTAATENDSGAIHALDHVSTVTKFK